MLSVRFSHKGNCGFKCTDLQHDTRVHYVFKLMLGKFRNNCPTVMINAHKPLRFQLAKRFAYGNMAYLECGRYFILPERHSARKYSADDRRPDYFEYPVARSFGSWLHLIGNLL